MRERNELSDADRIKRFCLSAAINFCDIATKNADNVASLTNGNEIFSEMFDYIEQLVRIAKMCDEIKED